MTHVFAITRQGQSQLGTHSQHCTVEPGLVFPFHVASFSTFASACLAFFSSLTLFLSLSSALFLIPRRPDYTPLSARTHPVTFRIHRRKDCNRSRGPLSTCTLHLLFFLSILVSTISMRLFWLGLLRGGVQVPRLKRIIWIAFLVRSLSSICGYDIAFPLPRLGTQSSLQECTEEI